MGKWGNWAQNLLFLSFGLGLSGCGPAKIQSSVTGSCSSRVSTVYNGPAERSYCSTTYTHSSPVTISGSATFESRPYTLSTGLNPVLASAPIRYAEVVAYNTAGEISQCGETDNTGNFSLQLPTSSDVYTIKIYTRGDNTQVKASVLNCPEENIPYSISATVTPDSSKPVGVITANADNYGELLGAAFNIYEQILQANEFLRREVGTCSFTGCNAFTVAQKVQAYWAKGFNPNDYFNSNSGLSFYLPTYRKLFILGGIDGDIFNSDTDHFDNSVILHEYGHFLEDIYTDTDSPGGSHSGSGIVDPRLAWGEGWGNFIQAAIRDEAKYRDTDGTPNPSNPNSSSMYIFNIPIETPAVACGTNPSKSGCDAPIYASEGNFREFSVTRMLWDVFDGPSNTDSVADDPVNDAFAELWTALTWSSGFLNINAAFRNVGLLHDVQSGKISGSSDWSSLKTVHKQDGNTEYARYVKNTGAACGKQFSMAPLNDPINDNGSFATSHRIKNNDFLHYYHPGGALTLSLKALTTSPTGVESDLDLYLYNSSARYGNASDIVKSADAYSDNNPATEQIESFSLTTLAAGNYLINVKVFTGRDASNNFAPAGDPLTYELLANGVNLCTSPLP